MLSKDTTWTRTAAADLRQPAAVDHGHCAARGVRQLVLRCEPACLVCSGASEGRALGGRGNRRQPVLRRQIRWRPRRVVRRSRVRTPADLPDRCGVAVPGGRSRWRAHRWRCRRGRGRWVEAAWPKRLAEPHGHRPVERGGVRALARQAAWGQGTRPRRSEHGLVRRVVSQILRVPSTCIFD